VRKQLAESGLAFQHPLSQHLVIGADFDRCLKDIKALCKVEGEGIMGAITGRAVYQGTLKFAEAQKLADKLSKGG